MFGVQNVTYEHRAIDLLNHVFDTRYLNWVSTSVVVLFLATHADTEA